LLVAELGEVPLIGFAGAPFTLASYLVEGGPSRDHAKTKAMMHGDPELWRALLERLGSIAAAFLRVQVEAGARVVQLFDSWAGALSAADYTTFVQPHSATVLADVARPARAADPLRVSGTGELLTLMGDAGADVVGRRLAYPAGRGDARIGPGRAVQGNLDPALLFAPTEVVEREALRVIEQGRSAPGHVFNLGHGVLPGTDPGRLTRLVDFVHAQG
jgi:uroporphyrinogen decarboxylase